MSKSRLFTLPRLHALEMMVFFFGSFVILTIGLLVVGNLQQFLERTQLLLIGMLRHTLLLLGISSGYYGIACLRLTSWHPLPYKSIRLSLAIVGTIVGIVGTMIVRFFSVLLG